MVLRRWHPAETPSQYLLRLSVQRFLDLLKEIAIAMKDETSKSRRKCNLKSLIFSADDIEKTVTQLHLTSDGFCSAHYIFNTFNDQWACT